MKILRVLGVMTLLITALSSCAPKYGCVGLTDATLTSPDHRGSNGAIIAPVLALEICPD